MIHTSCSISAMLQVVQGQWSRVWDDQGPFRNISGNGGRFRSLPQLCGELHRFLKHAARALVVYVEARSFALWTFQTLGLGLRVSSHVPGMICGWPLAGCSEHRPCQWPDIPAMIPTDFADLHDQIREVDVPHPYVTPQNILVSTRWLLQALGCSCKATHKQMLQCCSCCVASVSQCVLVLTCMPSVSVG